MTASKLPGRPSLEFLRKQAKKLARSIVAGDAKAIARARAQLLQAKFPLSQRDAQLVLAREYGFPGWQDLIKEVKQRRDGGLEWAVSEARRRIHDNDVEGLRQLLMDYPALLLWKSEKEEGGLLGMATGSYGDSFNPVSEQHFTRAACAELLLDAGAVVAPSIGNGLIASRAKSLLEIFHRRGLLPRSLKFFAALGDMDGIRGCLDTNADDRATVNEAFVYACHLQHPTAAALLLDRAITLDPDMGKRIESGPGRPAFVQYFVANKPGVRDSDEPWQVFVKRQAENAMREGDLTSFVDLLRRETWMLSEACVEFQVGLINMALLGWTGTKSTRDYGAFIIALFDLDPAVLHCRVPPPSEIIATAFTYAKSRFVPMLRRVWPMPDDLPHAAGNGDLARVEHWFDAAGNPALGDLTNHFPANNAQYCGDLQVWFGREPRAQDVLDTAFAWAVLNNHFDVADFLLGHRADINTTWSSHEPASILHELVWHDNYEAMQFLIDRGIDMTIQDYRWNSTAEGWARYAAHDEKMAQWLAEAQKRKEESSR